MRRSLIREQLLASLEHWATTALFQKNKNVDAVRLLKIAWEADLKSMEKFLSHTQCLIAQFLRDSQQRQRWCQIASTFHPDDFDLAFLLANELGLAQQHAEAEGCYRQALAIQPNNAAVWNDWGTTLHQQKKYNQAIAKYKKPSKSIHVSL